MMNKPSFGIGTVCGAVSGLILVIVVSIVGLRVLIGPAELAAAASQPKTAEELEADPEFAGKKVQGIKLRGRMAGESTFIVSVDENEFERARLLEKKRVQRLLDEADRLTGNKRNTNLDGEPPELFSFSNLPPEEKNRIWWEIADIASLRQEDAIRYTLTIVQARRIGKHYNTSVLEVFNLFREGANASWRTDYPPEAPEEDG